MLKAFKYRLSPTKAQAVLLNKHIGSARFIYNLALETKQMAWAGNRVNLTCFDLMKQLPDLKTECEWLKEVNAQSLQQAITNLDKAFTSFFKGQNNFPKFKKKSNGGSFNVPQAVALSDNKLLIPKFREGISIILHRPIKGKIRQATVSRTPTGKYFASILCETGEENRKKAPINENTAVGIDLGLKTFLVASDGQEFENPKFLRKAQGKLKFIQRKYSKHKGKRTRHRLAALHEKVANQRKDFLHKVTDAITKQYDTICIEDLAISNMLKNPNLALSISDAAWGMFTVFLGYKSDWRGKNILQIGRFDPSSKLHNVCGHINRELKLSDREWVCQNCGEIVLRDLNAAINIKNFALKNYVSGTDTKTRNELPTLVGVMTSEAHPIALRGWVVHLT